LNWFDNKVKTKSSFSNPFQNPLSVKLLEYMALNERGVNCLRGIFANFEGIMKINVELQRKKSKKQRTKIVSR